MNRLLFVLALSGCRPGQPSDGVAPAPFDSGQEPDSAAPGLDPRFDPLREAMALDLASNLASAVQVAVWLDGEVQFVGALGTADPDTEVPVGERTVFAIGSDTKKLAALHALQRVQAGSLSLDTRVAEALPTLEMALAPAFENATLENLLQHEGGIVDSSPWTTTTTDAELQAFTLGDFASQFYPLAPPGTFWNYANPNFSLAGAMDEASGDGTPWADALVADLTAPLGMTRTFARRDDCDDDHTDGVGYAAPDSAAPGTVRFEDTWESAWVRPAGLVWSTASDQARLAGFLMNGDDSLLEPALLSRVSEAAVPIYPDIPGSYGMGLFVAASSNLPDGTHTPPSGGTAETRCPTPRPSGCFRSWASPSVCCPMATATGLTTPCWPPLRPSSTSRQRSRRSRFPSTRTRSMGSWEPTVTPSTWVSSGSPETATPGFASRHPCSMSSAWPTAKR